MSKNSSELNFWSLYANHIGEQIKQTFCAKYMGIEFQQNHLYNLQGKNILEIGAGPVGLSLRCYNGRRKIIDPLEYPQWVWDRYNYFGVEIEKIGAEDIQEAGWDEVWILNTLQHVDDLAKTISKIKTSAKVLRIFDWLNIPIDEGHPNLLTKEILDDSFDINGNTIIINHEYMYNAEAYYGVYNLVCDTSNMNLATKLVVKSELAITNSLLPKPYGTPATIDENYAITDYRLYETKWGDTLHRAMIHYIKERYPTQQLTGIEIGTLDGTNAEFILETLNIETLYIVDPYIAYPTDTYTQEQLNECKNIMLQRLDKYKNKVNFIFLPSEQAIRFFRSARIQVDFIYIDEDHEYHKVLWCIDNYYPIAKSFIGGHDYLPDIVEKNRKIQVQSAVRDYAVKNKQKFYCNDFEYSDWWVDQRPMS